MDALLKLFISRHGRYVSTGEGGDTKANQISILHQPSTVEIRCGMVKAGGRCRQRVDLLSLPVAASNDDAWPDTAGYRCRLASSSSS